LLFGKNIFINELTAIELKFVGSEVTVWLSGIKWQRRINNKLI
jgi:hypothetical protein